MSENWNLPHDLTGSYTTVSVNFKLWDHSKQGQGYRWIAQEVLNDDWFDKGERENPLVHHNLSVWETFDPPKIALTQSSLIFTWN